MLIGALVLRVMFYVQIVNSLDVNFWLYVSMLTQAVTTGPAAAQHPSHLARG
jgi:hypothetical protein